MIMEIRLNLEEGCRWKPGSKSRWGLWQDQQEGVASVWAGSQVYVEGCRGVWELSEQLKMSNDYCGAVFQVGSV